MISFLWIMGILLVASSYEPTLMYMIFMVPVLVIYQTIVMVIITEIFRRKTSLNSLLYGSITGLIVSAIVAPFFIVLITYIN